MLDIFHLESKRFAKPGTYNQLGCNGRHCANCGKCRDWQFTGDLATWQWLQGVKSWTSDDVNRWNNDKVWKRFTKRDGATCTYVFHYVHGFSVHGVSVHGVGYLYHGGGGGSDLGRYLYYSDLGYDLGRYLYYSDLGCVCDDNIQA